MDNMRGPGEAEDETPLFLACEEGSLAVVRELITRGANVNLAMLSDNYTPLHVASRLHHVNVVRELLAAGATIDLETDEGATAFSLAAALEQMTPSKQATLNLLEDWQLAHPAAP